MFSINFTHLEKQIFMFKQLKILITYTYYCLFIQVFIAWSTSFFKERKKKLRKHQHRFKKINHKQNENTYEGALLLYLYLYLKPLIN